MHTSLDTRTAQNRATLEHYLAALNYQDVQGIAALVSPDIIFENTFPAPDGERLVGRDAFLAFTQQMFQSNRETRFTTEDLAVGDDRATIRWRYDWVDGNGNPGHIRGASILRLADGLITEDYSYVKG